MGVAWVRFSGHGMDEMSGCGMDEIQWAWHG